MAINEQKRLEEETQNFYYVLGWDQPNLKVAILCRSTGGPFLGKTWKETIKTRTGLLNDQRALANEHARQIIKELRIYKLPKGEPLIWRPGDLWSYVDRRILEKLEQ